MKNYSFEAAEYLTKLNPGVTIGSFGHKTDSKAMIRRMRRAKSEVSWFDKKVVPTVWVLLNMVIIYLGVTTFPFYNQYQSSLLQTAYFWIACFCLCFVFSWLLKENKKPKSNLMTLLQAPEYPVLENICAECLRFQETAK